MGSAEAAVIVFCIDAGNDPCWAAGSSIDTVVAHDSLDGLPDSLARALGEGQPCALGVEAPCGIPIRDAPRRLTKARQDEDRAWSASAGAASLACGIAIWGWVFRQLAQGRGLRLDDLPVTANWRAFFREPRGLLLWEAYITRSTIPSGYERNKVHAKCFDAADCVIGVREFLTKWGRATDFSPEDRPYLSVPGAAATGAMLGKGDVPDAGFELAQAINGLVSDYPLVREVRKPDYKDIPAILSAARYECPEDAAKLIAKQQKKKRKSGRSKRRAMKKS